MPILIMHGTQDTIVPPELGQALFDMANEPKRIKWYDCDHDNMPHKLMADEVKGYIAGL